MIKQKKNKTYQCWEKISHGRVIVNGFLSEIHWTCNEQMAQSMVHHELY